MGKASSSKKVARAAGTGGGRTNRSSTPWTFVGLIGLIVVVGVALTFTSRHRAETEKNAKTTSNATVAPTVGGTPWNEGFAVYICGKFEPPIKVTADVEGLTTDGNGVVHIAPKIKSAAGRNATLGELAKSLGITVSASEIKLPGAKTYSNGDDCAGQAAKVYVKQYPYVGAAVGTLLTQDPGDVPLVDQSLLTVAFVPPADKSKIPAPPSYVDANLKKISAASTTTVPSTTTLPSTATTTGSTTGSPSTTVGKSTGTTLPTTTTTATSKSTASKSTSSTSTSSTSTSATTTGSSTSSSS